MPTTRLLLLLGLLVLLISCTEERTEAPERGQYPWVFRSVLDERPRMLTAALHPRLYVAYNTETGALYKAWRGGVELDGAVYTTAHGPQPESIGAGWTKNPFQRPWVVVLDGQRHTNAEIRYRGHRFEDEQVYLMTELRIPNTPTVLRVSERPEYLAGPDGQTGLERTFFVEGLPAGAELKFQLETQGLPYEGSLSSNGEWEIQEVEPKRKGGLNSVDIRGELTLRSDGPTYLRTFFVRQPTLAPDNAIAGNEVDTRPAGERLIERSGCKTCHNRVVQTVGPAYVAVADRYPNTPANVDKLTAKVIKGGSGVWGPAAMTPHDHLPEGDVRTMVQWVMDLDQDTEVTAGADGSNYFDDVDPARVVSSSATIADDQLEDGARIEVWNIDNVASLDQIDWSAAPIYAGVAPTIDISGAQWGKLEDFFAARFTGYLRIPRTSNYLFRLRSDDGSRLTIDGNVIIDHDGLHGPDPKDGEIALSAGNHPFEIKFFENGGGQAIILEWRSFESPEWTVAPTRLLGHDREVPTGDYAENPLRSGNYIAGDRTRVAGVHPSYTLSQARPDGFTPKVGGMDFLSDGRLAISTWDAEGAVYLIDGVQTGDPARMTTKKIATGLAEPLGLKVVDDTIYVMQKQELTQLIDHDGDEIIDEYATVSNDWLVSANFHEFGFGLAYREPYFYATLAIGILPGGASATNQPASRGKAVRIHRHTGQLDYVASGLRTPNGIGPGIDGELFIADNQGDWLPSSKILHLTEGAFFNSYAVEPDEPKSPKPPVVWLPQDEIGNSPSTPSYLNDGRYTGQMIHGEVTHGGIKRVFVERVDDAYQGTVFRFIQGLEAGVNRIVWGPDSALYVGMVGSTGNWGDAGKLFYGLQRLKYNGEPVFEVLAVRTLADGFEVEFTEPVAAEFGDPADFQLTRWRYVPTADYGGPKVDETALAVDRVTWSDDRKRARLSFDGLRPGHVYYLLLPNTWRDRDGRALWSTESWTTVNALPGSTLRTSR